MNSGAVNQQGQGDVVAGHRISELLRQRAKLFDGPNTGFGYYSPGDAEIDKAAADALDRLSSSRGEQGWRTMDSAPKDGTYIILGNAQGAWVGCYVARYQSGFVPEDPWHSMMMNRRHMPRYSSSEPTHWMPLPSAPGSVPTSTDINEVREVLRRFLAQLALDSEEECAEAERTLGIEVTGSLWETAQRAQAIVDAIPFDEASWRRANVPTSLAGQVPDGYAKALQEISTLAANFDDEREAGFVVVARLGRIARAALIAAAPQPTAGGDAP